MEFISRSYLSRLRGQELRRRKSVLTSRPLSKNPSQPSEDDIQATCVEWFRIKYPHLLIFSVPNGARTSMSVAVRLKRTGLLRGIPDLIITTGIPGKLIFIEMKTKKTKPSSGQLQVHQKLRFLGFVVEVCHSFDQFQSVILNHLSSSPTQEQASYFSNNLLPCDTDTSSGSSPSQSSQLVDSNDKNAPNQSAGSRKQYR